MEIVMRWVGVFTITVVLVTACRQPVVTSAELSTEACTQAIVTPIEMTASTPTPLPVLTPSPVSSRTTKAMATVTPNLANSPSPTPIATLQSTPTGERNSNIVPFTPRNWISSLVISDTPGQNKTTDMFVDGTIYISWTVINDSHNNIGHTFFVDVYLDGVLAQRWLNQSIEANQQRSVTDWKSLSTRVRLQPGTHILKLVVDPTNLIPETNELDNVFVSAFTWAPSNNDLPVVTPSLSKLPDLVPYAPNGWTGSLIATSYRGDKMDGPLSVDVPTYIRYGFQNRGLASVEVPIWAYLYLDDVLVSSQLGSGLLADETVGSSEWAGLFDVINVTSGVHILRLELDATNLILEVDERNNTVEREFIWGTGTVAPKPAVDPTPLTTVPVPLTLPNLVPGWKLNWDGPIIVSHETETFLNSPLTVDETPFVDVIIHNESIVEADSPFSVDLCFDDRVIHSFEFPEGMKPNGLWYLPDWDELATLTQITEGIHTLKIVIDSDDAVTEADEGDNVYQVTLMWRAGIVEAPVTTIYSILELRQKLVGLQVLIDTRESALSPDGRDYTRDILEVVDAGYYLLTGKSLLDERVDISLLNHKDYLAWIDDYYAERLALNDEAKYTELLAELEKKKASAGLKTSRFGKIAVVIDAERDIADVIGSLVHELGHMRQVFLNPDQVDGDNPSFQSKAIHEAQAQQFERAFWLKLETFTGLTLLTYPNYQVFRDFIENRFDYWVADISRDEHFLGYLLQWLVVLDDPNLVELKQELTAQGRLRSESSLKLYDYLVGLAPESIEAYATSRIQSLGTYAETIKAISRGRLVLDLYPGNEGSPNLRDSGLLAP